MTKLIRMISLVSVLALLVACGQPAEQSDPGEKAYVVLNDDLQQLKDDFNANAGRVRLMFLSGPTCGICLRGMADLNDEFIAAGQNDDRFITFVVHVPTLGAKEEHVADTIPLLNGPRVHHYWEDSGIIGSHYSDVMDVDMYVWDFWAIYGPEARWDGTLPPKPDYFEHQLGVTRGTFRGFPRERVLDAERFSEETRKYIDQVDASRFARQAGDDIVDKASENISDSDLFADGTIIPTVAQPRNVAVSLYIRNRGGYTNLKRIQNIDMHGSLEINGQSYPFSASMARPNQLRRVVSDANAEIRLPAALESKLLETFEFDGLLVEWPDKGHQVSMAGMLKLGDVLAWKLDLTQNNGQRWHLYVDSHGGDLVRADMLDENDKPEYSIIQSDFRETAGFKFAHRIQYADSTGQLLGIEVIDEIAVAQEPFNLSNEAVTH